MTSLNCQVHGTAMFKFNNLVVRPSDSEVEPSKVVNQMKVVVQYDKIRSCERDADMLAFFGLRKGQTPTVHDKCDVWPASSFGSASELSLRFC